MDQLQAGKFLVQKLGIGKEVWYMMQEDVVRVGMTRADVLRLTKEALVAHA